MPDTTDPQTGDLAARLEAVLTERFTELGNPFSRMRIAFQGPDGWPASKEVGPRDVAEVLRELLAAEPAAPPVFADRAGLRQHLADAIRAAACPGDCGKTEEECARERIQPFVWHHGRLAVVEGTPEQFADAVLPVLPPDGRAGALLCAADWFERDGRYVETLLGHQVATQLRRLAAEERDEQQAQQDGPEALAAALDGLHTLIATSSRDWGTYRVDAWLWAVLCGWDCEQAVHDETCTHGALEETAAMHGWDAATVAKARRYRAAVRVLTEPAVTLPGKEA